VAGGGGDAGGLTAALEEIGTEAAGTWTGGETGFEGAETDSECVAAGAGWGAGADVEALGADGADTCTGAGGAGAFAAAAGGPGAFAAAAGAAGTFAEGTAGGAAPVALSPCACGTRARPTITATPVSQRFAAAAEVILFS
jgi:hypothetical protein